MIRLRKEVKSDKNALTGNQIIKFIKKFKHKNDVEVLILSDLNKINPFDIKKNFLLINLTKSLKVGKHWIVLKRKRNHYLFFDSYDLNTTIFPKNWINYIKKSDDCIFQNEDSKVCGQYCALYIVQPSIIKNFKCTSENSEKSLENDMKCLYIFEKMNKIS